jgi:hypothetical protein
MRNLPTDICATVYEVALMIAPRVKSTEANQMAGGSILVGSSFSYHYSTQSSRNTKGSDKLVLGAGKNPIVEVFADNAHYARGVQEMVIIT